MAKDVTEHCTISATLEFYNPVTKLYVVDNDGATTSGTPYAFVKTFDKDTLAAAGTLVIETIDKTKYGLRSSFLVRITISLPESLKTDNVVEYYF